MTDIEHTIEKAVGVMDENFNPDRNPIMSAMFRHFARALAEAGYLAITITRDDIDRALINVTSNAMNYPTPSQMLGKDSGPLRRKCVDAMCDLLGIEEYGVLND